MKGSKVYNMSIYTRTGDGGDTSLANGQRINKSSPVIDFVGDLDELNSSLGLCVSYLSIEKKADFSIEIDILKEIQGDLFKVGAIAAGSNLVFDSSTEVSNIEKTIDDYEDILAPLKNFILPGGSIAGSQLHYTRTLVRKLERKLVALESQSVMQFLPYLNRLSDLLFVMARFVNHKLDQSEDIWRSEIK